MTRFSRLALLLALGAAIAFLGFHRLVLTDLIFGKGDAYYYFTPLWAARDAALRAGQLPLWTDKLFMGAPLLADSQLGTFYPPNWLTVGLPAWQALKISVFIHVAWAAAGAFLLARRTLGVGIVPAVIGAAVFALGGYVGAHAEQINQLQGIAWMPWAFWCFARIAPHTLTPDPSPSGRGEKARDDTPPIFLVTLPSALSAMFALALVLALIALSGHTQTLFITGVGLGVYALAAMFILTPRPPLSQGEGEETKNGDVSAPPGTRSPSTGTLSARDTQHSALGTRHSTLGTRFSSLRFTSFHFTSLFLLAAASVLALILAAVQILPTLELTGLSNRSGGFSGQAAMAFSWQPNLAARGLLPSLDGQIFGEYVAYLGVFGLALAAWGVMYGGARRWPWLILAVVGVIFAFGLYNPLYWLLAGLPGFNLFRVPARWLGLFALGGAMLSALGAHALVMRPVLRPRRALFTVFALIAALAVLAVWRSPLAALEVDGDARPTPITLALWAAAALLFANAVLLRGMISRRALAGFLLAVTLGELAIAATNMPHRDLVDPMAATDPRQTAYYLRQPQDIYDASARMLSISPAYFDTYDHAGLLDRYARLGMTERAAKAGLTAVKLKEILAPNFPLLYGVASVDGFGGGLLPTVYYSAFTSLFLPEGTPRTLDGRLRELLARPECFGACVPEPRWLALMGVRWLVLDKTYDRFYDDVQFDLGVPLSVDGDTFLAVEYAPADQIHLLATSPDLTLSFNGGGQAERIESRAVEDGLTLLKFAVPDFDAATTMILSGDGVTVRALTLVDSRTGAFTMRPAAGGVKLFSSDIKVYDASTPYGILPALEVLHVTDDWDGSEAALTLMRDPAFDPIRMVVLHGAPENLRGISARVQPQILSRTPTRTEYRIAVQGDTPAVMLLNDAYYPGWTAEIDGQPAPLYRADVMFRAVVVPPGNHDVVVEYKPPWLTPLLAFGAAAWLIFALIWLAAARVKRDGATARPD